MARTVKPEEYAAKRTQILNTALRLLITRGYEQWAIQDILHEIHISSGAFHHYFDSRGALLEALIERMLLEAEKPLLPILHDPQLPAIEKLQGFFGTQDRLRIAYKSTIVEVLRAWYADQNATLRQKVDEATFKQRAPLLSEIVRQGIREGVFTTAYPDQAGEIILSLLQGMGNTHAKLLLSLIHPPGETGPPESESPIRDIVNNIVTTHAAYMDAIERALGAPPNSLYRTDAEAVQVWVNALRADAGPKAAETAR